MADVPGEKALIRLIELLEKAGGGLLGPWQTRREARARAEARRVERLVLQQTEHDIQEMRAGRKRLNQDGRLIDVQPDRPRLLEAPEAVGPVQDREVQQHLFEVISKEASSAMHAENMQIAINLKKIALFAEEEAERIDGQEGQSFSDTRGDGEVDQDWFAKWRAGAEDVSKEEMQRLWAKLLAGEVAAPGTYSHHTINFLSRMSASDASLLAKIAPYVSQGRIIKVRDGFFEEKSVSFENLLYLNDLGLINGVVGPSGLSYNIVLQEQNGQRFAILVIKNTGIVMYFEPQSALEKISFEVITITQVGREVLSLADFPEDDEYIMEIANKSIKKGASRVERGTLNSDRRQLMGLHTIATKPKDAMK